MSNLDIVPPVQQPNVCYHCGEKCLHTEIDFDEKKFCCNGCVSVYQLLHKANLCSYYDLNANAGSNQRILRRSDKFSYLDNQEIAESIIQYRDGNIIHITFHIPIMHCSSCIYLLENLFKINKGVIRSDVNFVKKQVTIIFDQSIISLRQLVELLTDIGYEPHIGMKGAEQKENKGDNTLIYKLGVAGFAFGNIMLLSFPDYFSGFLREEAYLSNVFRYLALALSLPVFFYCSDVFLKSAWKGLKHGHLNIDAPVSIVILTTFIRSVVDILFLDQNGYLDSLSGIVFFMLVGRIVQDKTYKSLSFQRDFTDYFPLAATVLHNDEEIPTPLDKLTIDTHVKIHNNELIPADGILIRGKAQIDYSFVTGESVPRTSEIGAILYAGGKQLGEPIEIRLIKEVRKSYLTDLWSRLDVDGDEKEMDSQHLIINKIAHNFTLIILIIAALSGIAWFFIDSSAVWNVVTSILIVACPCGLLLTSVFTKGFVLRIMERNGLFLKNAHVIDKLKQITHIVFDKTGTLTAQDSIDVKYFGDSLSNHEEDMIFSLAQATTHPLSKPVRSLFKDKKQLPISDFVEHAGLGVEGTVNGNSLRIGTIVFIPFKKAKEAQGTILVIEINGVILGYFEMRQIIRYGMEEVVEGLEKNNIVCSLLSGDQPYQKPYFEQLFGKKLKLLFRQGPEDKLNYIQQLQSSNNYVAMVGDGLNDAGALGQANVGISITEDANNFTPAGDVILLGKRLEHLDKIILLAQRTQKIIFTCLAFSIIYNVIGLSYSIINLLNPLIAAILMPTSTLTIVLITYFYSKIIAKRLDLNG